MFQIGAIAALEDHLAGFAADGFDVYVCSSSGATVGVALAAGRKVQRIYRSFLDPADDYFPLERGHILRADLAEWRRTAQTALAALGQGSRSLLSKKFAPSSNALWEELARLYDSMPAGLFSLDGYERFLIDRRAFRQSEVTSIVPDVDAFDGKAEALCERHLEGDRVAPLEPLTERQLFVFFPNVVV